MTISERADDRTATGPTSARIRVLHSLAPPDGTTKYVNQMAEGAASDVDVRFFSWRAALTGDYDVLHLHWPELLLRARTTRMRLAKRFMMRMLLTRLRRRSVPLVRTLHNTRPHEQGASAEQRLLDEIDRRTELFIRLNPTTTPPDHGATVTVLHGHYRDRFAEHPRRDVIPGRLLYFGIIRPYKGVEELIDVFREMRDPALELRIVGSPTPGLRARVEAAAEAEANVSCRLAFVDDAELVAEISAAELVVLPYKEMHNSGALIVALSLDRPVLVPSAPSNAAMSDEVGAGWVLQYDGELRPSTIERALAEARTRRPSARPDFAARDWDVVGRAHRDAYHGLLRRRAEGR